ncbi:MAG: hypothetical protein H7833_05800 [Magnetococcus sp. DMHC-1]|nr:hypothetical protein [Magnetococcales bacterium]
MKMGSTMQDDTTKSTPGVRKKRTSRKSRIDRQWWLDKLQTVVERCLQEEPVKDRSGNPTGEFKMDVSGANKALELIGRHLQMEAGADNEDSIMKRLQEMTDEELDDHIERFIKETSGDPDP